MTRRLLVDRLDFATLRMSPSSPIPLVSSLAPAHARSRPITMEPIADPHAIAAARDDKSTQTFSKLDTAGCNEK
ncbi:hypothetical protein ADU20_24125 [Burkholderia pseudomallei]|nr:hypothetical protein ADU20_24125 [Burkholderia pseudomallei]